MALGEGFVSIAKRVCYDDWLFREIEILSLFICKRSDYYSVNWFVLGILN